MKACRETVLAIIPAHTEGRFIARVVKEVLQHVHAVLVIDDGSVDDTATLAEAAGATVIRHDINQGKGAALKTGLNYASETDTSFFLFLDADGQHDPQDIPRFYEVMNRTAADLVVGNRMNDLKKMPLVRQWTNRFMSWQIGALCKVALPDSQCGFRLARRELVPVLMAPSNRFEFETESLILAARHGFRIVFTPIKTIYADQQSKIRPIEIRCDISVSSLATTGHRPDATRLEKESSGAINRLKGGPLLRTSNFRSQIHPKDMGDEWFVPPRKMLGVLPFISRFRLFALAPLPGG